MAYFSIARFEATVKFAGEVETGGNDPSHARSTFSGSRLESLGYRVDDCPPATARGASLGAQCIHEYTLPHEFGHHIANWLLAKDEMRDVVVKFVDENFELGKKISDYAAMSPDEAWAEGFEELHNRPEAQWHIHSCAIGFPPSKLRSIRSSESRISEAL